MIYGSAFYSGYTVRWFWTHPKVAGVLFSSHGLFSWTPILMLAVAGLVLTWKQDRVLTISFVTVFLNWFGISSFGNRFFVSLTPLFVLGLAMVVSLISGFFVSRRRSLVAAVLLILLLFSGTLDPCCSGVCILFRFVDRSPGGPLSIINLQLFLGRLLPFHGATFFVETS